MAKRCETFDHTADVGLAATADTLGELYEALAEGLTDVVCRRAEVKAAAVRPLRVAAEDREALAVDFLAAALNVMQTDHFLVAAVRVRRADERSLEAELHGERYDPTRHELKTEVKAVTYHQLKVARDAGRWTARVILDL